METSQPPVLFFSATQVSVNHFLQMFCLEKNYFEHRCNSSSVTHETEWKNFGAHGRSYVVFNVPGLIEHDPGATDRNKIQIERAFQRCPNSIVVSVFANGKGGRLRDDDLVTFKALNDVYQFKDESFMFIINGLPAGIRIITKGKQLPD